MRMVRNANRSDLPKIVELYNSNIPNHTSTADTVPFSVEGKEEWFRSHSPTRNPLWVCEQDGEFVGWIGFSFYRGGRPALLGVRELSYFVDAGHLREGIGSFMLKEAIAAAPDLGIQHFLCFLLAHNTASIGLLESHGFQRWGLLPGVARFDGRAVSRSELAVDTTRSFCAVSRAYRRA